LKVRRTEYHLVLINYKCLTVEPNIGFILRDESSQLALIPMIGLRDLDLDA
jgi:hypothetical protein